MIKLIDTSTKLKKIATIGSHYKKSKVPLIGTIVKDQIIIFNLLTNSQSIQLKISKIQTTSIN